MPDQYPLPAHAASFWIAGDDLLIAFPGQGPQGQGHTVRLPASVAGLQTAINILRERAKAPSLRLGAKGTPSQYELEQDKRYGAILKAMRRTKAEMRAAKAKALVELEELGL